MIKKKSLKEDLDKELDKELEKRFGPPRTRVFTSPESFFKYRKEVKEFIEKFYENKKYIG
jgi:hypothetical protein